jgi:hypothetical protein
METSAEPQPTRAVVTDAGSDRAGRGFDQGPRAFPDDPGGTSTAWWQRRKSGKQPSLRCVFRAGPRWSCGIGDLSHGGGDGAVRRVSAMPRRPENRPVRLSKHAQGRVDAGEVRLDWIEATIRHPAQTQPDPRRPGATLSFRRIQEFGNRTLRVAHRSDGTDVLIITAFFDRGARLR